MSSLDLNHTYTAGFLNKSFLLMLFLFAEVKIHSFPPAFFLLCSV